MKTKVERKLKQIVLDKEYNVEITVRMDYPKRYRADNKIGFYTVDILPQEIDPNYWNADRMSQLGAEVDTKGSKIWKEYNRAEVDINRTVFRKLETHILSALRECVESRSLTREIKNEDFENAITKNKLVYNRRFGCSCGCSPAFQLKDDKYKLVDMGIPSDGLEYTVSVNLLTDEQLEERAHNIEERKRKQAERDIELTNEEIEELKEKLAELEIYKRELIGNHPSQETFDGWTIGDKENQTNKEGSSL